MKKIIQFFAIIFASTLYFPDQQVDFGSKINVAKKRPKILAQTRNTYSHMENSSPIPQGSCVQDELSEEIKALLLKKKELLKKIDEIEVAHLAFKKEHEKIIADYAAKRFKLQEEINEKAKSLSFIKTELEVERVNFMDLKLSLSKLLSQNYAKQNLLEDLTQSCVKKSQILKALGPVFVKQLFKKELKYFSVFQEDLKSENISFISILFLLILNENKDFFLLNHPQCLLDELIDSATEKNKQLINQWIMMRDKNYQIEEGF